ncbi:hypothetical protein WKK05_10865 [Nostoc sp. UHCC 0302]
MQILRIGSISIQGDGQVFLTNQFQSNNLQGSIEITSGINTSNGLTSVLASGNPVTIDAISDVTIAANIFNSINNGTVGNVKILSEGNITTAGIESFVAAGGNGDGGNITLTSRNGSINTRGKIVSSTPDGNSGNIRLQANSNITIANEIASRILEAGAGRGRAGTIDIISNTGNINLVGEDTPSAIEIENIRLRKLIRDIRSSNPNGIGGNITLTASQGQILVTPTGRGQTVRTVDNQDDTTGWKLRAESSNGVAGDVTLTALGNIQSPNIQASSVNNLPDRNFAGISINSSTGTVFIDNATLNTTNTRGNASYFLLRII